LTYASVGLVNGDALSGGLTTTATTTSNVGSYGIEKGTLANSNYTITYVGADLTVTAAPLTVTANTQSRTYGAANPTLSYVSTGLVNGDTLSGGLATTATTTSNVGSYGIEKGTLANSNYTITYAAANLTVTPAPLTVTANAQSRAYGAANPSLTYVSAGLVNGDTLSGLLATSATTTSNVGSYSITQGTLAASSNYALTYTGANLTVTAAPPAATVDVTSPPAVRADTQPMFPSYFVSNGVSANASNGNSGGENAFASADVAASDSSTCTPAGVLQNLNRYGRVDLTGGNAASCLSQ
jgi:MBG domain (YGX type)